jgi:hypothetical protein
MSTEPQRTESLRSKLKRYLFSGWLLHELDGDVYLAHAIRQRNRERYRRHLPHYVKVHAVLASLFGGLLVGSLSWDAGEVASGLAATALAFEVCFVVFFFSALAAFTLETWDRSGDE